jgi:hypothetical protein
MTQPICSTRPIAIDLCAGLMGWSAGLVDAGFDCFGFDIEDMFEVVGAPRIPNTWLVLQNILTIHGRQFRNADLIVASPPCQEYSYMAMPWSRAKQIRREYLDGTRDVKQLTALFDACFRIQREACEAAGRHIPMVVENVRGAQEWVGRSRWNYSSYHLWGDVPALMPVSRGSKGVPHAPSGHWTSPAENGTKQGGDWFSDGISLTTGSKSAARKAFSAHIAKIPFALSHHIGMTYMPRRVAA